MKKLKNIVRKTTWFLIIVAVWMMQAFLVLLWSFISYQQARRIENKAICDVKKIRRY